MSPICGIFTKLDNFEFSCLLMIFCDFDKTSLLRRLHAQTLPNATLPTGKIHLSSKIAVTFEPIIIFFYFVEIQNLVNLYNIVS